MTNAIGSETKTYEYIIEARSNKIEIEKPTINESDTRYIVKDNKIIYPLSNIKINWNNNLPNYKKSKRRWSLHRYLRLL